MQWNVNGFYVDRPWNVNDSSAKTLMVSHLWTPTVSRPPSLNDHDRWEWIKIETETADMIHKRLGMRRLMARGWLKTEHGKLVWDSASHDGTKVSYCLLGGAGSQHINRSRIGSFCGMKINKCVKVDWTTKGSSQNRPHGRAALGQVCSTTTNWVALKTGYLHDSRKVIQLPKDLNILNCNLLLWSNVQVHLMVILTSCDSWVDLDLPRVWSNSS